MSNLSVSRSVQFVSLDTHPANNALVLTYEIIVSVIDKQSQRELSRRNKRDQMLINIAALDGCPDGQMAGPKPINLQELGAEIVRRCPILLTSRSNLEDIQLHLLYLVSRRQSQLSNSNEKSRPASERPNSSLGRRLGSASLTRGAARAATGRQSKSSLSASDRVMSNKLKDKDIYANFYLRELQNLTLNNCIDEFLEELDERLGTGESIDVSQAGHQMQANNSAAYLETQLESLYGDLAEKLTAVANLRRISKNDARLLDMSSNRLLVCAMLRTLRDVDTRRNYDGPNGVLAESILYCLLRMTLFADIYTKIESEQNLADASSMDMISVVLNLLVNHVDYLKCADNTFDVSGAGYYHTRSLMFLILNIFQAQVTSESDMSLKRIEQGLLSQNQPQFVNSLLDLFQTIAKHLTLGLRTMVSAMSHDKSIALLDSLVRVFHRLSVFREFANQLRASKSSAQFFNSLVALMNTLQVSYQPASGTESSANAPLVVHSQRTLNGIHELEISLFKLVNNILFDPRLKTRMIERNFLKCALRNIVVFLASRSSSQLVTSKRISYVQLDPFYKSAVLLAPFKSLYELSCTRCVRVELTRSKIIIKCLSEYLIGSALSLRASLSSLLQSSRLEKVDANHDQRGDNASARRGHASQPDLLQFIVKPERVEHYINALWVNLEAECAASMSSDEPPTFELLNECLVDYIELTIANISSFLELMLLAPSVGKLQDCQTTLLMHLKLLRTHAYSLSKTMGASKIIQSQASGWCDQLADMVVKLIDIRKETDNIFHNIYHSLAVESLATLGHMLSFIHLIEPPIEQATRLLGLLFEPSHIQRVLYDSDADDLLLVGLNFLANLARHHEVCEMTAFVNDGCKSLAWQLILVTISILDNSNDYELTISALYSFSVLMNHRSFMSALNDISSAYDGSNSRTNGQSFDGLQLKELVERLTNLLLSSFKHQRELANYILNRLRQLDEQHNIEESVIYGERFASYNSKWLAAIKASREGDLASTISPNDQNGAIQAYDEDLLTIGEQDLRTIDTDSVGRSDSGSAGGRHPQLSAPANKRFHRTPVGLAVEEDELDDDELEEDDNDFLSDGFEGAIAGRDLSCDLSVVDAHSMIHHLKTNQRAEGRNSS